MRIVAKDHSTPYQTVAAALDGAPEGEQIYVRQGEYREKLTIAQHGLRIVGEGETRVKLVYSDAANDAVPGGRRGTFESYTLRVAGSGLSLENLTIENDAGDGRAVGQSVALHITGDRACLRRVTVRSHQDTLLLGESAQGVSGGRAYFDRCTLRGDVDFICGSFVAWFEGCALLCNNRDMPVNGYVTAANTPPDQAHGFVFHDCAVRGEGAAGTVYLGRPWRPHAQTVFLHCAWDASVHPALFCPWSHPPHPVTPGYAVYPPESGMHPDARAFTPAEAAAYSPAAVLGGADGWNPLAPPPEIYLCGDSTVCDYPPERAPQSGWGQALAALSPYRVRNLAIGGRSAKSFVTEGRLDAAECFLRAGDFLLVQFGHNDAQPQRWRHTAPDGLFKRYLALYAEGARDLGAQAVFVTPVPTRSQRDRWPLLPGYAAAMREAALAHRVPLIDLAADFAGRLQALSPEAQAALYMPDGVHLTREGAQLAARIVWEALAPLLPEANQ